MYFAESGGLKCPLIIPLKGFGQTVKLVKTQFGSANT